MASALQLLTGLMAASDRYDVPFADLRQAQLEALEERFRSRIDRIPLLRNRADAAGIRSIRELADLVPLLFAHTAYKSYPDGWLAQRRWDRLGRWLDTVSTQRVAPIETSEADDLDAWLKRLEASGHLVSCSSGTTGKCAMLNATAADIELAGRNLVGAYSWATGVAPARDRRVFGLAPVAQVPRNVGMRNAVREAFAAPGSESFDYPIAPITIGQIAEMVILRRRMAEGSARPADIAAYEAKSAAREQALERSVGLVAEALVANRAHKLYLSGLFAPMFKIAAAVRALGYGGDDFNPQNTAHIGGGLKGATLPPNYREYIFETFNLKPERIYHGYGMQELNTSFPKCRAGRYHIAPWVVPLLLDPSGERLLEATRGEIEGRAAFFDLTLDGRWGGVISGDRVSVTYETCACGHRSASVADTITRYADLPGGDKISCAGNIEAYVRGVA